MNEDYQRVQPRILDPALVPDEPVPAPAAGVPASGATGFISSASATASAAASGLFTSVYENRIIVIVIVIIIVVVLCAAYYYKYHSGASAPAPLPDLTPGVIAPAQTQSQVPAPAPTPASTAQTPAVAPATAPAQAPAATPIAPAAASPAAHTGGSGPFTREAAMETFIRARARTESVEGVRSDQELSTLLPPIPRTSPHAEPATLDDIDVDSGDSDDGTESGGNTSESEHVEQPTSTSGDTDAVIDEIFTPGAAAVDAGLCTAVTGTGKQCRNRARSNGRCHHHSGA